jgi:hypothetical protein
MKHSLMLSFGLALMTNTLVAQSSINNSTNTPPATVYIYRPDGATIPDFKVTVNDKQHLYLSREQVDTVYLTPGPTEFKSFIGDRSSGTYSMDLKAGETVYLRVYDILPVLLRRVEVEFADVPKRMFLRDSK